MKKEESKEEQHASKVDIHDSTVYILNGPQGGNAISRFIMSTHGGYRTGAVRPPGQRNKKSEEQLAAAEVGGLTPLDYLLSVMRDEARTVAERTDAAKAAAP